MASPANQTSGDAEVVAGTVTHQYQSLEQALAEEHCVDIALRRCERVARFRRNRFRELPRCGHQLLRFDDAVECAHREQFLRLVMAAHQDGFLRAPWPEPGGEYAGRSAAIWHLEIHFRHPELRAFDRDREIECQHERPSAADRVAVDRADRDLIEMRQHVERTADQPRPSLAELAHASSALCRIDYRAGRSLEHRVIGASTEGGAFASHDEHAAFAIVADGMQTALEI